jgi:hypothetical protein
MFVLFCFEAICDRYFFKLNCFKLGGWFYHHNVFPLLLQIFALLFGIKCTEINQSQSSNIFMYIINLIKLIW